MPLSAADVVKGIVVDPQGEPLIGVTVQEKGTQNKTITNVEGRYALTVKGELPVTLVFSFIGMKTVSRSISSTDEMRIRLEEDASTIKDVVIVGAYGTMQKRSDLVGSAYQVTSKDLENLPALRRSGAWSDHPGQHRYSGQCPSALQHPYSWRWLYVGLQRAAVDHRRHAPLYWRLHQPDARPELYHQSVVAVESR